MNETYLMIAALVAILSVFGVLVATTVVFAPQQADARGCTAGSTGFNASQGRCFQP